jgi:hypothetical protein
MILRLATVAAFMLVCGVLIGEFLSNVERVIQGKRRGSKYG